MDQYCWYQVPGWWYRKHWNWNLSTLDTATWPCGLEVSLHSFNTCPIRTLVFQSWRAHLQEKMTCKIYHVEFIDFKRGLRYWYQPKPAQNYFIFVSKLKVLYHQVLLLPAIQVWFLPVLPQELWTQLQPNSTSGHPKFLFKIIIITHSQTSFNQLPFILHTVCFACGF